MLLEDWGGKCAKMNIGLSGVLLLVNKSTIIFWVEGNSLYKGRFNV